MQALVPLVATKLSDHLKLLRSFGLHHAAKLNLVDAAKNFQVREGLREAVVLAGVSSRHFTAFGNVSARFGFPRFHPCARFDVGCREEVSKRLACYTQNAGGKAQLDAAWRRFHVMSKEEELEPLQDVHRSWKATVCYLYGAGRWLCRGQGITIDLARKALADTFARLAPKKSLARRLLLQGFLVFEVVGGGFFHISVMYLRPRRPTLLRCKRSPDRKWGRICIEPVITAGGVADIIIDVYF